jgi:hypothetical protein
MDINLKYMIPLQGEYNAGVSDCPNCDYSLRPIEPYIIGFADSRIGKMIVCECPECFTKWHFHLRGGMHYDCFLQWIEMGEQLHYCK